MSLLLPLRSRAPSSALQQLPQRRGLAMISYHSQRAARHALFYSTSSSAAARCASRLARPPALPSPLVPSASSWRVAGCCRHPTAIGSWSVRHYTPMTKQEEEAEKQRVAALTPFAKDQELRQLNRQISKLEMLRGINTGELYTWRGRYKELYRNYGLPLMVWYGACWVTTGALVYAAVEVFGVDAMSWIAYVDTFTGFGLASKVDPGLGKAGLVVVVNEMIEPVRLPLVILTCKPVVDRIAPTKY